MTVETVKKFICDNCGKGHVGEWPQGWISQIIDHGKGASAWEEKLVACSLDCVHKLTEKHEGSEGFR